MESPLFYELLTVFGLSIAVLLACNRFRVPLIVGYLMTGIIVGPSLLNVIPRANVETLASLGVILLLFGVGVEFSLRDIFQARRDTLLGGGLQLLLTALALALGVLPLGVPFRVGLFMGLALALSSTTLIMKELASKAEVTSPHGRSTVAILIFQDFASVPLMLALGLFAGNAASLAPGALWVVLKAILVLAGTAVLGAKVIPPLMDRVAMTRSQELFHISAITLCLAIPALLAKMGLPVALGAFLAGLILADSDYAHSTLGSLLPVRDIFASLFFISIGMLLDFRMIASEGALIVLASLGLLTLKAALGTLVALTLSKPLRTAILIGTAISPAGEFGLLLIQAGSDLGVLGQHAYQVLLGVMILTMALTPAVFALGRKLAYRVPAKKGAPWAGSKGEKEEEVGALLIVGFGIVGQGVALAAKYANIPYRVVELNPLTVRKEKQKKTPILFGDATNPEVLSRAGIHTASALVITVHADPLATRRIVSVAKHLNPSLTILARVAFLSESKVLRSLGADEVVIEEMEAAIALFGKVLTHLGLKEGELAPLIERLRLGDYGILRSR